MLKTNQQLLEEKIAYANKRIENYNTRIQNLTELIKYNRDIIDKLVLRRKHEKVSIDVEKNVAKKLTTNAEKASQYEQQLREENHYLADQLDIAERHLATITKTKAKLQSLLGRPKNNERTK